MSFIYCCLTTTFISVLICLFGVPIIVLFIPIGGVLILVVFTAYIGYNVIKGVNYILYKVADHIKSAPSKCMSCEDNQEINLKNLDLNRTYTFEEFELINKQLKKNPIEVDGEPVDLFEFRDNKLVPMPQCTIKMEAVVSEIVAQLRQWNVQTRKNGIVTSSQGGFNFNVGGKRTIEAPDIAFTPRETYDNLTKQQRETFKGEPFSPIFVVEVGNIAKQSSFDKLDSKFKDDYFAKESAVQLGWLVDPINKKIYVYKRGRNRQSHGWRDINDGEILPEFTLDIQLIEQVIEDTESSGSESTEEQELNIKCPICDEIFNKHHFFMVHYEKAHARKWRKVSGQ